MKDNDLLALSSRLHAEAKDLLRDFRFDQVLGSLGRIFPTGSYFLDLMVYPDLDLYMPMISIPSIFTAAGQIANNANVIRVTFENEEHPTMQGGLYLNFRVNLGTWGRPWKVDIWWLEPAMLEQKMEIIQHFKDRLTPELGQRILQFKFSIIDRNGRTPMYSGYYIYKAFLDEGLREHADITQYLVANGIHLT